MVKLLCPDCHKTDFVDAKALLKHAYDKHDVAETARETKKFWARQEKEFLELWRQIQANLDFAQKVREQRWIEFAKDPKNIELPKESNIDHLHDRAAWLVNIEDDGDEESDKAREDGPSGSERSRCHRKWANNHERATSLRYHANNETMELACAHERFIKKATPTKPLGLWYKGHPEFEDASGELEQNRLPKILDTQTAKLRGMSRSKRSSEVNSGDDAHMEDV